MFLRMITKKVKNENKNGKKISDSLLVLWEVFQKKSDQTHLVSIVLSNSSSNFEFSIS